MPVNSYRTKSQSDGINNENEEVIKKFSQTMDGLKSALKKQTEEIKSLGETSPETAKALKSLTEQLEGFQQKNADLVKKHEELFARMSRPGQGSSSDAGEGVKMSPGQAFIASKSYSDMLMSKGYNSGSVPVCNLGSNRVEAAFKTGDFSQLHGAEFKGLRDYMDQFKALTSDSGSMGVVIIPQRIPGIFGPQERPQHIRDLMNVSSTSSNSLEYIEETGYTDIVTSLTGTVASASAAVPVANVNGFFPGQVVRLVESGVTTVTGAVLSIARAGVDAGTITLAAAAGEDFTAAAVLEGDRFAATPEARLSPEGNIKLEKKTVSVKDISKALTVTRQLMNDAPQLRSYIDSRVMAEGEINLDWHLLNGSGTGDELQGLMTHAGVQAITQGGGDTKLDVIRKSYTMSKKAEYPVNGLILSPDDVEDIELLKGSDDKYIMMMMNDGKVWRVPYVETNAIQTGKFVAGNLNLAATLYDREQASIRSSDSHGDYFLRQLVALLYTQRLANVITRPEAITVGTFT